VITFGTYLISSSFFSVYDMAVDTMFLCFCEFNVSLLCFEWIIFIFFYALCLLKWKIANVMTDREKSLTIWQSNWWNCSEKRTPWAQNKIRKIVICKNFLHFRIYFIKIFSIYLKLFIINIFYAKKFLKQSILWYSSNSLYFDSQEVCMKSK
jgi:hypothetical protein